MFGAGRKAKWGGTMRATKGITLLAVGTLLATSAIAQVDQEQAFNLCVAQPVLQSDFLMPIIDEKLSRPHDPTLDYMSRDQLLNAAQFFQGRACATELVDHPDVFWAIAGQHFASSFAWEFAWVAFNTFCRQNLTGACIKQETAAAVATQEANSHGMTAAGQACSITLASDVDFVQMKVCMDAVDDKHPDDKVISGCAGSVPWHSQQDGAVVGQIISECVAKGG
jgi:hypothetical protein